MTQPTLQLIRNIVSDAFALLTVETSLARVEIKESARAASSGLALLAAGAAVLVCGTIILLIAAAYFLMRLGAPADLSFLIVAAITLLIGGGLLRTGAKSLSLSRLAPKKSLAQLSAIFRGH